MLIFKKEKDILKDEKGVFSLLDAILAIVILFVGLLIFNTVLSFYNPSLMEETHDSVIANDIIESMTLKIDENSYSILDEVIFLIESTDNGFDDFETKHEVTNLLEGFFNRTIPNHHYLLIENNVLNGTAIVKNGNIDEATDVTSATHNIGNYSFTLFIFNNS